MFREICLDQKIHRQQTPGKRCEFNTECKTADGMWILSAVCILGKRGDKEPSPVSTIPDALQAKRSLLQFLR